ncbi:MAG: serine/threonine-protein kinase [bacterium]|nr:serine/threonine-protein kinase [bacterium]
MNEIANNRINRYELRERLGAGGMARVYKAWDTTLERTVAMKILHDHLAEDPTLKERFLREARFVASLSHPHIVQVYDFDVIERNGFPMYYMVMSYIAGQTLREFLEEFNRRKERLPLERVLQIFGDVAGALGYAHAQGTVHRDVKPGNILLDKQGSAILTDFGIARMIHGSRMTQDGISTGTPLYMSPEQASGQSGDARSDLYSLGIILYEMLAGKPPFEDDGAVSVMIKHINTAPPSLSSILGVAQPAFDSYFEKALAKNPNARYQTAQEMLADLKAIIGVDPAVEMALNSVTPSIPQNVNTPSFLNSSGAAVYNTPSPSASNIPLPPSATQTIQQAAVTSFAFLFGVILAAVLIIGAAVVILRDQFTANGTTNAGSMTEMRPAANRITANEPYFNTDFDSDDSLNDLWIQGERGGFSQRITPDGIYELTLDRSNTAEVSVIYAEVPYANVGIELRGALADSSSSASAYGVVFRYQDQDNYNVFAVDGLGRFSIWVRQDGQWTELRRTESNWEPSQYVRTMGQSNRVTVEITGNTFTGYVNNNRVVRVTDSTFDDGQIGIYIGSDDGASVIEIDSFKVYPSVPSMTGQ